MKLARETPGEAVRSSKPRGVQTAKIVGASVFLFVCFALTFLSWRSSRLLSVVLNDTWRFDRTEYPQELAVQCHGGGGNEWTAQSCTIKVADTTIFSGEIQVSPLAGGGWFWSGPRGLWMHLQKGLLTVFRDGYGVGQYRRTSSLAAGTLHPKLRYLIMLVVVIAVYKWLHVTCFREKRTSPRYTQRRQPRQPLHGSSEKKSQ